MRRRSSCALAPVSKSSNPRWIIQTADTFTSRASNAVGGRHALSTRLECGTGHRPGSLGLCCTGGIDTIRAASVGAAGANTHDAQRKECTGADCAESRTRLLVDGEQCATCIPQAATHNGREVFLPEWAASGNSNSRRGVDAELHCESPLPGSESHHAVVACGAIRGELRVCCIRIRRWLLAEETQVPDVVAACDSRHRESHGRGCNGVRASIEVALKTVLCDRFLYSRNLVAQRVAQPVRICMPTSGESGSRCDLAGILRH